MWAIAKRELQLFFGSAIGYAVIGIFLTMNALLLWLFDGPFNILNAGFADLNIFFEWTPWMLLFLISAICMRSFSDEIRLGTIEIILTKPITLLEVVLGKFLGAFILVVIALVPTAVNILALFDLKEVDAEISLGNILGSYLGLSFLSLIFIGISILTSLNFKSSVTSFLLSLTFCFLHYNAWEQLAGLMKTPLTYDLISNMGIQRHYLNIGRGVVVVADLIYFVANIAFFLFCALESLKRLRR